MTTNKEIREFAKTLDVDDPAFELPRNNTYHVKVARAPGSSEESKVAITPPIKGYYHALYACDMIEEELGYAGMTLYVDEVTDTDREINQKR